MAVTLEDGGRILRGVGIAYDQPAVVLDGDIPVVEIMDRESIVKPPVGVPLLVGHDRTRAPVGVVRSSEVRSYGLAVEAEMLVSDAEMGDWRRRFAAGVADGLSAGYIADRRRAVWERPARPGGLPVRRPRGVEIIEMSLTHWPAFEDSRVLSLSTRTGGQLALDTLAAEFEYVAVEVAARGAVRDTERRRAEREREAEREAEVAAVVERGRARTQLAVAAERRWPSSPLAVRR